MQLHNGLFAKNIDIPNNLKKIVEIIPQNERLPYQNETIFTMSHFIKNSIIVLIY